MLEYEYSALRDEYDISKLESRPEADRGLSWESHLLNAEQSAVLVERVVDVGKVQQCGTLTHSSEFVVDRAVANADPAVVSAEVRNGHAAEMSADCRADQHLSVSSGVEANLADLIKHSGFWQGILLLHFLRSKPSNEDWRSIPYDLQYLSWWNFRDIHLKIGVAVISGPSVEPADDGDCVEPCEVGHSGVVDGTQHVDLGAADVGFVLVVHPVFIEPVVKGGLEVDVVSEVSGTG